MHGDRKMKTNDIKIIKHAEYYYATIDLVQTIHSNQNLPSAKKVIHIHGVFFNQKMLCSMHEIL